MKQGTYALAIVGTEIAMKGTIMHLVQGLVQEISTAHYKNSILEYIGSPTFVVAGNQMVAMQAMLLDPAWVPEKEPEKQTLKLVQSDKKDDPGI